MDGRVFFLSFLMIATYVEGESKKQFCWDILCFGRSYKLIRKKCVQNWGLSNSYIIKTEQPKQKKVNEEWNWVLCNG